jgi:hypothetical protein
MQVHVYNAGHINSDARLLLGDDTGVSAVQADGNGARQYVVRQRPSIDIPLFPYFFQGGLVCIK